MKIWESKKNHQNDKRHAIACTKILVTMVTVAVRSKYKFYLIIWPIEHSQETDGFISNAI